MYLYMDPQNTDHRPQKRLGSVVIDEKQQYRMEMFIKHLIS